jgi:hypothetical protein
MPMPSLLALPSQPRLISAPLGTPSIAFVILRTGVSVGGSTRKGRDRQATGVVKAGIRFGTSIFNFEE